MNAVNHIIDSELPVDRNFDQLKALGIDYIQELASNNWNDMNDSDPGITILEQLCFALAELGYCNNFPVEDILCRADNTIPFSDQFFLPDDILTSSPVTLADYRKLLLDLLPQLRNVYIYPESVSGASSAKSSQNTASDTHKNEGAAKPTKSKNTSASGTTTGRYELGLDIDPEYTEDEQSVIDQVMSILNSWRNLGESFIRPVQALSAVEITLEGTLRISDTAKVESVLAKIASALKDYVSPMLIQCGYSTLRDSGLTSCEIFNGPKLTNGWTGDPTVAKKKLSTVTLDAVSEVLGSVPEIRQIESLELKLHVNLAHIPGLENETPLAIEATSIAISQTEIPRFIVSPTRLKLLQNAPSSLANKSLSIAAELHKIRTNNSQRKIGATIDLAPDLPKGSFRNIQEYYSVQNTFPTQYAIGYDSIQFSAPDYRIAQSRQLKGYLMVFDQVLANQFSQLAHVGDFFSFNTRGNYYDNQDKWFSWVPYRIQDQTYYYQPLYSVPNVQPLLVGNEAFKFSINQDTNSPTWLDGWKKFKEDPFNEYISGLRERMETAATVQDRQSRMLDHLLARHGESGTLLGEWIVNARWEGNREKTATLVKRILLQNYQALSYNRTKAYNTLGASELLLPGRFRLTMRECHRLQKHYEKFSLIPVLKPLVNQGFPSDTTLKMAIDRLLSKSQIPTTVRADIISSVELLDESNSQEVAGNIDGWLDTESLERKSKLSFSDFNNYSSFELSLNLVFGLRDSLARLTSILIQLTETSGFKQWLRSNSSQSYPVPGSSLHVSREHDTDRLYDGNECLLTLAGPKLAAPSLQDYRAYIDQLLWLAHHRQGCLLIESIFEPENTADSGADSIWPSPLAAKLIFPSYVNFLQTESFTNRLNDFIAHYWPLHVAIELQPLNFEKLQEAITQYTKLHNNARRNRATSAASTPNGTPISNTPDQSPASGGSTDDA